MTTDLQKTAQDQLRNFIERVERLQESQAELASDIRDVFSECRAVGFDVKAIRKILKLRKKSASEREEEDAILSVYMNALGLLPSDDDPRLSVFEKDDDVSAHAN